MDYLRKTSDGSYEVRIAVPAHLRAVLKKKNLTRRLGTKSRAEAKRGAPEHVLEFQRQLAEAQLGRNAPPPAVELVARWAICSSGIR